MGIYGYYINGAPPARRFYTMYDPGPGACADVEVLSANRDWLPNVNLGALFFSDCICFPMLELRAWESPRPPASRRSLDRSSVLKPNCGFEGKLEADCGPNADGVG